MVHPATNKRNFFRVPLANHPGTVRIIEIAERPVTIEARPMVIIDAGGGGLCITSGDDIPIRRGVVAIFEFTLGNQSFSFRGTFVRKLDDLKKFEYGVRFIDIDERKQSDLISVLGRMQVRKQGGTN